VSRWWRAQLTVAATGLALRLAYVLIARRHAVLWGDAYYYHYQAQLLLQGRGFIVPFDLLHFHRVTAAADHPPMFTLLLAGIDLLGVRSFAAHRVAMAVVGTLSVVVVGLVGRQVGGDRVGLVAAGVAALDPSFWVNDGLVESETLVILATALAVWAAYRFWERPGPSSAGVLGAACGLAALVRAEMALVVVVVALPLVWFRHRGRAQPGMLRSAGALLAAATVVVAPWVGRNMVAFDHPVYLSDGLDVTLTVANCDQSYHGDFMGYWWLPCATEHPPPVGWDESDQGRWYRAIAYRYMKAHPAQVPVVAAVRVGRVWNLYRPLQQTRLDLIEGRELWVSRLGLVWYYPVAAAAVAGGVILRRRRTPVLPLGGLVVVVSAAVAVSYGNTRYRAAAEVAMAVLAAVAADAPVRRWRNEPAAVRAVGDHDLVGSPA